MKRTCSWKAASVLMFLAVAMDVSAQAGPFAIPRDIASDPGAGELHAVDLDADGDVDLVSVNTSQSRVSWARNERGAFAARRTLFVLENVTRVAFADFDRDGRVDVAAGSASGVLQWRRLTTFDPEGNPVFVSQPAIASSYSGVQVLAVGDADGNGRVDLLVGRNEAPVLQAFLNTGAAGSGFAAPTTLPLPGAVSQIDAVALGDLDGNGRLDVAATALTTGSDTLLAQVFFVPRTAANTFGTARVIGSESLDTTATPTATLGYRHLGLGDQDRDGDLDVLALRVGNTPQNNARLLEHLNDGSGAFAADSAADSFNFIAGTGAVPAFALADFDRDGDVEPMVSARPFSSSRELCLFDNARPFSGTDHYLPFSYAVTEGQARAIALVVADFDVDGDPDLAWADVTGALRWSPNERIHGGAFLRLNSDDVALPADASPRAVLAADLDGNGLPEAVVGEHAGRLVRLPSTPPATFPPQLLAPIAIGSGAPALRAMAAGDFDHDGNVDVVVGTGADATLPAANQNSLLALRNIGSGALSGGALGCETGNNFSSVALADMDRNGFIDLGWAAEANHQVGWSGGCPGVVLASSGANLAPNAPGRVQAADIDGDGDADFLVTARLAPGAGQFGRGIGWYPNTGNGTFAPVNVITDQLPGAREALAVDIDADGDLDVLGSGAAAGFDPVAERLVLFRNLGEGSFAPGETLIAGLDGLGRASALDADQDGDMDLMLPVDSVAVGLPGGPACGLGYLENDGAESFRPVRCIGNALARATRIAVTDLQRDGDDDVVAINAESDTVTAHFGERPLQFRIEQAQLSARVTLMRGGEQCFSQLQMTHLGRAGDAAVRIRGLTVNLHSGNAATAQSLVDAMVLRRDDGDGEAGANDAIAASATALTPAPGAPQGVGWTLEPAATSVPAQVSQAAGTGRFFVCARARTDLPNTLLSVQTGANLLINSTYRHGDTPNFAIFGHINLLANPVPLRLENGNIFGHGFEQ